MRKIVFLLVCLGMAGCATTAKYEARLNTYIGQSEDALIASWGVPEKTYELKSGKKAIEFIAKNVYETGGYTYMTSQTTYASGKIGDKSYSGTSTTLVPQTEPARKYRMTCKTSFIIGADGRVESWHHDGNNCVSR